LKKYLGDTYLKNHICANLTSWKNEVDYNLPFDDIDKIVDEKLKISHEIAVELKKSEPAKHSKLKIEEFTIEDGHAVPYVRPLTKLPPRPIQLKDEDYVRKFTLLMKRYGGLGVSLEASALYVLSNIINFEFSMLIRDKNTGFLSLAAVNLVKDITQKNTNVISFLLRYLKKIESEKNKKILELSTIKADIYDHYDMTALHLYFGKKSKDCILSYLSLIISTKITVQQINGAIQFMTFTEFETFMNDVVVQLIFS
jgi:hypothetical protein